jgi:predicted unusual protein kinase regulating ubiquinone biosynthesis (AarF/ABC1/UbiB family)
MLNPQAHAFHICIRDIGTCIARRVLVMEWVTGVKLTSLEAEEIRQLVGIGQAIFLSQLLDFGFFHGDPHPGNLLKVGASILRKRTDE